MKKIGLISLIGLIGLIGLQAQAADIVDGDLIRAEGDVDVFIVKLINNKKFKRLILNPAVFNKYDHLYWENIKDVSQETVDQHTTTSLVRAVDDKRVYKLYLN